MKIIRTNKEELAFNSARAIANIGCNICPCCGETKSLTEYLKEGVYNKGISGGIYESWFETRLFRKSRHMRSDHYTCNTCGAQWKSDPYEIN